MSTPILDVVMTAEFQEDPEVVWAWDDYPDYADLFDLEENPIPETEGEDYTPGIDD